MKIVISGIGGVGGYFGGLLARRFHQSADVEIYFIAKGENEKAIRQNGLQLFTNAGDFTAHPKLVASYTGQIGTVDLLISCTKSYDLVDNMMQCKPCIDDDTMILPLQNGVDSRRVIAEIYPSNEILDGCVYIISLLTEPGIVRETGNIRKLFFGSENRSNQRLRSFLEVFKQAGIDANLSDDIQGVLWEKFVFISTIATLTSYLDQSIGSILADADKKRLLGSLLSEIKQVADAKGIALPGNIIQLTFDKIAALPFDATSSMQRDFKRSKRTELESLTGYVVRAAAELGVSVPVFEMMYQSLKNKTLN